MHVWIPCCRFGQFLRRAALNLSYPLSSRRTFKAILSCFESNHDACRASTDNSQLSRRRHTVREFVGGYDGLPLLSEFWALRWSMSTSRRNASRSGSSDKWQALKVSNCALRIRAGLLVLNSTTPELLARKAARNRKDAIPDSAQRKFTPAMLCHLLDRTSSVLMSCDRRASARAITPYVRNAAPSGESLAVDRRKISSLSCRIGMRSGKELADFAGLALARQRYPTSESRPGRREHPRGARHDTSSERTVPGTGSCSRSRSKRNPC